MLNKSRRQKKSNTRNKTRSKRRLRSSKRKTNKKGGQTPAAPQLSINYANIRIGGQELGRNQYMNPPKITLSNYAANFIVTMTDPDAPAGTWTHYVAELKPGGGGVISEPYKYEPPNPPPKTGTHHYIFRAYSAASTSTGTGTLRNNKNLPGNEYYTQVLELFIRNNKPLAEEKMFTVTSS